MGRGTACFDDSFGEAGEGLREGGVLFGGGLWEEGGERRMGEGRGERYLNEVLVVVLVEMRCGQMNGGTYI